MIAPTLVALVAGASFAAAQTITGPTDCTGSGAFLLCQNLWNQAAGNAGSWQTSTLNNENNGGVSWSTSYDWEGNGNEVKSYANVESNDYKGIQLSAITSAPTTYDWSYSTTADPVTSDLRADVSYDIWIGSSPDGAVASSASAYEVMIWLSGRGGAQPLGNYLTTVSLGGYSWNLWGGENGGGWYVYSFDSNDGDITNFDGFDLNGVFQYLIDNQGVPNYFYLQAIQAGTEPFQGGAQLDVSYYTVAVNQ